MAGVRQGAAAGLFNLTAKMLWEGNLDIVSERSGTDSH